MLDYLDKVFEGHTLAICTYIFIAAIAVLMFLVCILFVLTKVCSFLGCEHAAETFDWMFDGVVSLFLWCLALFFAVGIGLCLWYFF